jgi:hypothetical protein
MSVVSRNDWKAKNMSYDLETWIAITERDLLIMEKELSEGNNDLAIGSNDYRGGMGRGGFHLDSGKTMITCQNCDQKFSLNDSVSPDGSKAAGITWGPSTGKWPHISDSPILDYHNVWCPHCRTQQQKETLQ